MQPVDVRYHGREGTLFARGGRIDDVVAFRWGFESEGRAVEQLSFVLMAEGFLLAQPVLFDGPQRGWWYVDLITVEDRGELVVVEDLYVDVLVGPPSTPYRLLDLDELADAVTGGAVDAAIAMDGLVRCQRFLDRRLNRREDTSPTWPAFPPVGVEESRWAALPREWRWAAHECSDAPSLPAVPFSSANGA